MAGDPTPMDGDSPTCGPAAGDPVTGDLAVIIPVLDGAAHLGATLAAIAPARAAGLVGQVIVVDGGSRDDSVGLAIAEGALVLHSAPGRGRQMRLGAAAATAQWLLFLHADSRPDPGWAAELRDFCAANPPGAGGRARAAVFRLRFDDTGLAARIVAGGANWRARRLALPYGDQGLLIPRTLYDAVGGYRDMALMEDVDIARRLGRRRIRLLDHHVTTSAERYRQAGYARRVLRNLSILTLHALGVGPDRLSRLYR